MKTGSTSLRHCERRAAIHKQGFTLMELLVYMGIVGIIVVIAGEAFSNSTKFRIRTDNMIKATQEAENVAMLFKEDLAQMGTKSSRENASADAGAIYGMKFFGVVPEVYMDPTNSDNDKKDSSSFWLDQPVDNYSDLKFRRMRYDDNGYYEAVEEIHWYVENQVLKRTCKILAKASTFTLPDDDLCVEEDNPVIPVEMATGVTKFYVEAANPAFKEEKIQLFPPSNQEEFRLVPRVGDAGYASFKAVNAAGYEGLGGTAVTLSKFFSNFSTSSQDYLTGANAMKNQAVAIKNESGSAMWNALCSDYGKMTLRPDTVYEISFYLSDRSLSFVPGEDHMSVGFRKAGSGDYPMKGEQRLISDFLFYPPMDTSGRGAGKRVMRFTVPERIENVCLTFTFALYSPLASEGKVTVRNLRVNQVATASYTFDGFSPETGLNKKEKKNVKAFKLNLQVSRGAKNGGNGETGDVDLVIAVPSNGPRD